MRSNFKSSISFGEKFMKAIFYDAFMQRPQIANLPDPTPHDNSVVIAVKATGVCRLDWHAGLAL